MSRPSPEEEEKERVRRREEEEDAEMRKNTSVCFFKKHYNNPVLVQIYTNKCYTVYTKSNQSLNLMHVKAGVTNNPSVGYIPWALPSTCQQVIFRGKKKEESYIKLSKW